MGEVHEYRTWGSPGTGKTDWLSRQIHRYAAGYGSDGILVASFTRAAARQIAERKIDRRQLPIRPEQVGTLHAHCYRALGVQDIAEKHIDAFNEWLGDEAPLYGLSDKQESDVDEPFHDNEESTTGDTWMRRCSVYRSRMIPREDWPSGARLFMERWDAWKKEVDLLDFTDLIEIAYRDIAVAPGAPTVGFFDEAQDFVPLELALVRKWGAEMDYFVLVGDDDQTLYNFKGASPDAFLNPPIGDEFKRFLKESFRVPRAVHAYAVQWTDRLSRREPKEYLPKDADGAVLRSHASYFQPARMIQDIERLWLPQGKTVMILASCSYMLRPVVAALREAGIPFWNPNRTKRGDWNPLRPTRGSGIVDRLLAYLKPNLGRDEHRGPVEEGEEFPLWDEDGAPADPLAAGMWSAHDVRLWAGALLQKGVFKKGGKEILERWAEDRHDEPEIDELLTIFEEDAFTHIFEGDLEWFGQNAAAQYRRSMPYPVRVIRERGPRALREPPLVKVGTVHSVKGDEAAVTYLFPDISRSGMNEWVAGGESRDAICRMFYVGATRSKETLVLCQPSSRLAVKL